MAPRIVLAALAMAFGIAAVAATVTTVRQLNRQTWHSADGQSYAATRTNHPSQDNGPSQSQIDVRGRALVPLRTSRLGTGA